MLNRIKKWIKSKPLLAIPFVLIQKILPGYFLYRELVKRYGVHTAIFRTAWNGTGDYYICGMYLREYLKQNNISDYVFLVKSSGSERKVTDLFAVYQGHIAPIPSVDALSRFSEFMRQPEPLCRSFEKSDQLSFIGEYLKGYRGLSLMDFYLWYGFEFPKVPLRDEPRFSQDMEKIRGTMMQMGLTCGKTVILSPYSTCSKEYLPPEEVWEEIAIQLKRRGYTVATNCSKKDKPIKGTVPVFIPYPDTVPFLNEAGGFVGVRSGLCDILSQSTCKKIIIYPEKSDFWPSGTAKEFVGLHSMGLEQRSEELDYCNSVENFSKRILQLVDRWRLV